MLFNHHHLGPTASGGLFLATRVGGGFLACFVLSPVTLLLFYFIIILLSYFVIHLPEPTVSSGWVSPTRLCELARGLLYYSVLIILHPEPTVSCGWVSPARLSELAQGLLYYCILLYITLNQPCQAVGFRQLGYASWRGDCCIIVIILFYHTVMDHSTSHHHTTNHWRF